MNLGELLDELRKNILHDRSDRVAGADDYLWDDRTLVRYINQAERRFARRTRILRDGTTPDVTVFKTAALKEHYALHPSILAVMSVKFDGDHADIPRAGHTGFQTYRQPDTYFFDAAQLSTLPPGKPRAYGTDEHLDTDDGGSLSVVSLRLFPKPDEKYAGLTARMRVCRLPLNPLTLDDLDAIPEIPEDHHLNMLDWAAYLALRIVDLDGGAPSRANEFKANFETHCVDAKNEMMRKTFTPMQWEFGRNGFTWEPN